MYPLSAQFGNFAITAFLVYLVLRAIGSGRPGAELAQARRHALWCAVIGFFATSSSNWFDTFYQLPFGQLDEGGFWVGVGMALTPAVWLFFVYVAGQFTWPRNLKPQRSASLQPRSLSGLLPRYLALLLGLVLVCLGIALWAVRDVTALSALPARTIEREDYWAQYPEQPGIRGFTEILPLTLVFAGSIVLAVLGATFLILLRKPLPGISDHDNRLLRRTWLNRLFRTAIIAVSTLAGSLLHSKARWFSRQADQFADTATTDTMDYYDQLHDVVGQWDSVANYAVIGITIAMLFWRPPTDFEGVPKSSSNPVSRMREQLFTMQFVTCALTVLVTAVLGGLIGYEFSTEVSFSPTRGELTMLSYVGVAVFYLLANAAIMYYTHVQSRQAADLPKSHRTLPRWTYLVAGLLSITSLAVMLNPPTSWLWGVVAVRPLVALGLVALLLVLFLGFRYLVRRMTLPWDVDEDMEIWYRRVLELRALRAVTTIIVALPLAAYPFPAGTVTLALVIFLLPSAVVLERPDLARKRELAELRRTS